MRLTLCGLGNGFRLRHQGADCPSSHGCRQPAQAVERRLPPVLVLGERAVSPRRLWLPFRRRGSTVAPTTLVAVVNGERPRVGEGCGRSPWLCLRLIVPRPHCVQQLAPRSPRYAVLTNGTGGRGIRVRPRVARYGTLPEATPVPSSSPCRHIGCHTGLSRRWPPISQGPSLWRVLAWAIAKCGRSLRSQTRRCRERDPSPNGGRDCATMWWPWFKALAVLGNSANDGWRARSRMNRGLVCSAWMVPASQRRGVARRCLSPCPGWS